jgi:hypothetical protein
MRATKNSAQPLRKSYRAVSRFGSRGPGGMRDRSKHSQMFLPGEPVPETGIYEVIHDRSHRPSHDVVMHGQDLFPPCDQCDKRVRFKLVRTAPYIFDDEDFVEEP